MIMQKRDGVDTLFQARLEERLEQFELSWAADRSFAPDEFLDGLSGSARLQTLAELVRIDMELRSEAHIALELDDYLRRFPDLRDSEQVLGEIAFEDYRLRCSRAVSGDSGLKSATPTPGDYASRYGIKTDGWVPPNDEQRESAQSFSTSRSSLVGHKLKMMPETGDTFCGFRLIGLLGTGACGKVFLARQEDLANRLVSLKVTTQRSTESSFLARLQHSNVVPVFSVHERDNCNAICMPFLGLATLKDILNDVWSQQLTDRPPACLRSCQALLSTVNKHRVDSVLETIPNDQERTGFQQVVQVAPGSHSPWNNQNNSWTDVALNLAVNITDGLAHAHGKGIVHGDIKPANILITDDGEPVVLDFHLSQLATDDVRNGDWIGGTLPYMSPEMMEGFDRGTHMSDTRCDIWSIGVVLYEMFTGEHPWGPVKLASTSRDFSALITERRQARPLPHPITGSRASPDLLNIVHKCLTPDPSLRYQNAGQLHDDLLLHQHNRAPKHAGSSGLGERCRKFVRRHPKLASMTSVGVVSLVIIATLGWILATRMSRLAGVEALQDSSAFVDQALHEELGLSVMSGEQANIDTASKNANFFLEKWGGSTKEQLLGNTRFSLLPYENRQRELQTARNIHFWLAESLRRSAQSELDPDTKQNLLQRAVEENRIARSFFDKDTHSKSLELQSALLLRDLGQADQAMNQLSMASSLNSRTADDYLMTAWLLQQDLSSIEIAKQAIQLAPLNYTAWIVAGNIFRFHDRLDQASSCYEIAATIAPEESFAHYFLGRTKFDRLEYQKAIESFDRVLELAPGNCAAILNRGLCLAATGQWQEAEKAYSAAIQLGSNNSRIWFLRAGVRRELGNGSGAAEDFQHFMETEPADDISFVTRGTVLVSSSPDKAIEDFQKALQINPYSKAALQNLSHVYSELKHDLPKAVATLDELIEKFPNDATQIATRGVLHARAKSRVLALKDAEKALAIRQDADTKYRVAGIYSLTSQIDAMDAAIALRLVSQALVENPTMILEYMASDPDIEPLKSLTEWQEMEHSAKKLVNSALNTTGSAQNQAIDAKK